MRLLYKLTAIGLFALGAQWLIGTNADALDDAQFTSQVLSNAVCGRPTDDEIARAADRLLRRQMARECEQLRVAASGG